MCGIVAIYHPHGCVSAEALVRGTAQLHHRGPDGQRHWIAPHGRVGLGHARLSIIDLVTGDQPIANEDGRRQIVVNGEFYDFERIQRELERAGHRLRTRSDSEIALHLYEDVGPHCLHQLRGEYAFVLWDEAQQRIFAARDRFGIKPLFFAWHDGALYLASEVKALFAAGVPARWNREGLFNATVLGGQPTETLYAGVSQLPPGHYMLAGPNGMQIHRYWDFDYPLAAGPAVSRSDDEWAEEFRAALENAVRLRLRADVPVGCYLSGGLDSCAVLGFAARHAAEPIRAFTLAFDQVAYDEEAIAREMAAQGQRRVLSHSHTAGRPGGRLRRRHLARGDVLPQRPRRREVRAEPSRTGRGLQGGAHRRRLRRDSRRLPPFPPGHAALRQRRPGPGGHPLADGPAGAEQYRVARAAAPRWRGGVARRTPARPGIRADLDGGGRRPHAQDAGPVGGRLPGRVRGARALPRAPWQPRCARRSCTDARR